MGLVFEKIDVETPKFELIKSTDDYEIRKYSPSVIVEVTYDPTHFKGNKDGGFMILANYISAIGNPQNSMPKKITMTAPVITQSSPEQISMTAPVVTKEVEDKENKMMTMQFVRTEPGKNLKEMNVRSSEGLHLHKNLKEFIVRSSERFVARAKALMEITRVKVLARASFKIQDFYK